MIGVVVAGAATPVSAATPTPTPTLRPVPATPTSSYLYFRATPTPWSISDPPEDQQINIQSIADVNQAADIAINTWRWVNRDHLLDMITSMMVAAITFGLLLNIARRSTKVQVGE